MKRVVAVAVAIVSASIFAIVMITGWSVGRGMGVSEHVGSSGTAAVVASAVPAHLFLTIATPAMLGGNEESGPAFLPGTFTVPANSDVTVTIVNFDGATALPAGAEQFAKTSGAVGAVTTSALDAVHPNLLAAATSGNSLNPTTGISHTFTISKLGLNVPIAPNSRTTFTFHSGAAGVYDWRCMVPCGNGPAGWGAAMSADGFMQGKVTFG